MASVLFTNHRQPEMVSGRARLSLPAA